MSGGGQRVAEALGGKKILPESRTADERKILNVVEEMAIASGNPVPPVYIMEDQSINAFAAGLTRRDAVIGVTRGCIESLTRDELQGVIAHEFSHIHNGDMRLNMKSHLNITRNTSNWFNWSLYDAVKPPSPLIFVEPEKWKSNCTVRGITHCHRIYRNVFRQHD